MIPSVVKLCSLVDLQGCASDSIGGIVGNAVDNFAADVAEGFGKIMASLGTYWLYIPTPNLAGGTGSNSDVVSFIQNSLIFYVAIAAIIAIVISSIRLILTQKGEHFSKIARGIVTLIFVTAAGVPLLSLLIIAGDQFSVWIVNLPTDGRDFGSNLAAAMTAALSVPGGAVLVIVLGIIAICVSLTQVVLILIRMVMLVLLAGMLPLAGSFASTDGGKDWLKKYSGWLLAFLLYKPIAAIIYAVAFALVGNGLFRYDEGALDVTGQAIMNILAGLMLMVVAVIALGALMKFVTPAIGAIGGSAAGGALAAGIGAAATGAVSIMGMKSIGGGSSGGGAAPSGAGTAPTSAPSAAAASGSAAGNSAGAASSAGAAAGGGSTAAAGATAGAAAGPAGIAAGAAVGAAAQGVGAAAGAVKSGTENAVEGGPSGS